MGARLAIWSKAEALVAPIRDTLPGLDPIPGFESALKGGLADIPWLRANTVKVQPLDDGAAIPALLGQGGAETLLLLRPECRFSPAFDALTVSVTLHPHSGHLAKNIRPLPVLQDRNYANCRISC